VDDYILTDLLHGIPAEDICKRAADEITRLRTALAIAAGMLSTTLEFTHRHPQTVMEELLAEASHDYA